ncbi:MAG: acyltransferase domain-containing protein, partial [Bacteroidota bacterium]
PQLKEVSKVDRPFILKLSAKNADSLNIQKRQMAAFIQSNRELLPQDIEFSALYGRKVMPFRFSAVYEDQSELINQLQNIQTENTWESEGIHHQTVWMFPGQGSQFNHMAADLYEMDMDFKEDMDECFDFVKSNFDIDYRAIVFSDDSEKLNKTEHTQIALFIVEYCLAKKLLNAGLKPDVLIGHSLGEYVAACIAGCLSLEDALTLVVHRGQLMGAMPAGAMLLVQKTEEELTDLLIAGVSICVINSPKSIVVGGSLEHIEQQSRLFDMNQIKYRKLRVSHAYHTPAMQSASEQFEKILEGVTFNDFDAKIVSTFTAQFVDASTLGTGQYWTDQIMQPVRFTNAIEEIANYLQNPIFIEVGPGTGLSSFLKGTLGRSTTTVNLLSSAVSKESSIKVFYKSLAKLAVNGVQFSLPEIHDGKRVPIPGYAFLKRHFWKPQLGLTYDNFDEISQSFHYNDETFKNRRIKNSFEIRLNSNNQVSDHILKELDALNQKYLEEMKNLFNGNAPVIDHQIAAYFDSQPKPGESTHVADLSTFQQGEKTREDFVMPDSEIEKKIAASWGEILGYDPVSVNDDYFEAGGNSLLATHLVNKIYNDLQVELTIADVLTNSTVKNLSILIEEKLLQQNKAEPTNELII